MMTKDELKEESKSTDGNQQVKQARRRRRATSKAKQMAEVAKADVVVTNPTHYAVAMKYDPTSGRAPVVMAKGVDFLAARIRKIAEENDVPLVRNPPLARTLYDTVEVDQEIPAEHYRAVAEVITYVFKLKGRSLKG